MANILIVDDSLEGPNRLADILAAAGHAPRVAGTRFEVLREVARDPPDVILLDVETPVVEGAGLVEAVGASRIGQPPIPIVLLSASRHLATIAGTLGPAYYLRKPFGIQQVIRIVDRAVSTERSLL